MWLADWNISTQLMLSSKFSLRYQSRGRSRAAATSKMELFVIIVTGWKPLTIITKRSILDAAATLDPPLQSTCLLHLLHALSFFFIVKRRYLSNLKGYSLVVTAIGYQK